MLPELLEQQHGEEAGTEHAARGDMERCGRLRDLLARATGELLAYGLDDLPAARDHLERLGHVLAQLAELVRSAAGTVLGRGDDDAFARQMLGKYAWGRAPALESLDLGGLDGKRESLVLAGGDLRLLEAHLELVDEALAALRPLAVKLAAHLGVLQLEEGIAGFEIAVDGLDAGRFGARVAEQSERLVEAQNVCRTTSFHGPIT